MSIRWSAHQVVTGVTGYLAAAFGSLLDLVYPETCVRCGIEADERPWHGGGRRVRGLGWSDRPHLCSACGRVLAPCVAQCELAGVELTAYAGCRTNTELVAMLGHWKYRGVRGLAWPLAPLLTAAIAAATDRHGAVDLLVPVPLHVRRRRRRGFNQAEVLAHLAAAEFALPVGTGVLRRTRATGQQAKLQGTRARRRNVRGAFAARPRVHERGLRVGLVDDLVTGGATCCEAARALDRAGWQVSWVAALGLAAGPGRALDHTAGEAPVDRAAAEF